jgi:transcriptional regulator with PAS, ATPase and Fis domain
MTKKKVKNIPGSNPVWETFIKGEPADMSGIRPEIIASWQRCLGKVDPYKKKNTEVISAEAFKELKIKNSELIDIAIPVMDNIYSFVKGSGFSVNLCAVEGKNIYTLFDYGVGELTLHSKAGVVSGSNWAEEIMGTFAGNLCVYLNKPFQVYPEENFCQCLQDGTTSAAPIHDPDTGKIIGVLIITGTRDKVYLHTLGMVVAAVDSIEKQMATTRLRNKAEIDNNYKNLIMESTPYGVLSIDENMLITQANKKAINILGAKEELVGKSVYSAFSGNFKTIKKSGEIVDIIRSQHEVSDEFINLQTAFGTIRCAVTTRKIYHHDNVIGKILLINEMSRLNDLVTRTFGNYARFSFNELIGEDENFVNCIKQGIRVSTSNSNVLLLGESGTGKDLFAQSIHNASNRSSQPYIAINCAAIPRELIGSELFGYDEGAFTGAKKGGSPGKFELADGGTIFLDEIGEMPLDMQSILLRVLEEKNVTRIGGKISFPIDIRLIAATNKNLEEEVEKGNFREDLYYRLNVVNISLPPLRERRGDIPLFINYMVDKISTNLGKNIDGVDPEFILSCSLYNWPGNIRQLQNVIERCINLIDGNILSVNQLPENIRIEEIPNKKDYVANKQMLRNYGKTIESGVIQAYLEKYNGNKSKVARELGITRATLYRKLYGK